MTYFGLAIAVGLIATLVWVDGNRQAANCRGVWVDGGTSDGVRLRLNVCMGA